MSEQEEVIAAIIASKDGVGKDWVHELVDNIKNQFAKGYLRAKMEEWGNVWSSSDGEYQEELLQVVKSNIWKEGASLEREVIACLEMEPLAVRVREGNGPENLGTSLAVTMANMRDRIKGCEELAADSSRGVIEVASVLQTGPEELRAHEVFKQAFSLSVQGDNAGGVKLIRDALVNAYHRGVL
jgi:hypothetical protein